MARAARRAAPRPGKSPKTVGPLPDIMATDAPAPISSPSSPRSAGWRATQGGWRSFPTRDGLKGPRPARGVADAAAPPRLVEPAVGVAGADGQGRIAGVEEHEVEGRHLGRGERLAAAAGPGRARSPRKKGTSEPIASATSASGRASRTPKARARQRSTAAASEEPPPRPAVTGVRFPMRMATPRSTPKRARKASAARAARLAGAVELRPARDAAGHRAAPRRDADLDLVAEVERDHEAGEVVVAVGAERADPQDEVHLGRGEGWRRTGLSTTGGRTARPVGDPSGGFTPVRLGQRGASGPDEAERSPGRGPPSHQIN